VPPTHSTRIRRRTTAAMQSTARLAEQLAILARSLGRWSGRDDGSAQPELRAAAGTALEAIAAMTRHLAELRSALVPQIAASDAPAAARTTATLAAAAAERDTRPRQHPARIRRRPASPVKLPGSATSPAPAEPPRQQSPRRPADTTWQGGAVPSGLSPRCLRRCHPGDTVTRVLPDHSVTGGSLTGPGRHRRNCNRQLWARRFPAVGLAHRVPVDERVDLGLPDAPGTPLPAAPA
jgi:hypothetical protein